MDQNQTGPIPRNEKAPKTSTVLKASDIDSAPSIIAPLSLLVSTGTKKGRVFEAFMQGGDYNRFEAETALSDHCLHSTVSEIEKSYGVSISRQFETVPGFKGIPTKVKRYWMEPEEIEAFSGRLRVAALSRVLEATV